MSETKRAGWVVWVIGVLVTALYGYAVVAALGNLVGIPGIASALGLGVTAAGWAWLSLGVVLPIFVLLIAILMGLKRPGWAKLLLLVTGLCVVAVLQIDLLHLVPQSSYFG